MIISGLTNPTNDNMHQSYNNSSASKGPAAKGPAEENDIRLLEAYHPEKPLHCRRSNQKTSGDVQ